MTTANEGLEREARRRKTGRGRIAALVMTIVPFVATVIAIVLATEELEKVRENLETTEAALSEAKEDLSSARSDLRTTRERLAAEKRALAEMRTRFDRLEESTNAILQFLKSTASKDRLPFLDDRVAWDKTVENLLKEPSSSRRAAAFSAILAAWRKTPFRFNGTSLETGIDSPRFAMLIMEKAGVENLPDTGWKPGEPRLSDKLKERFPEVTKSPEPGDLFFAWVSNTSGRYVSMYLGNGVCIGIDGSNKGFQIVPCKQYLDDKGWRLEGYHRVNYPADPTGRG